MPDLRYRESWLAAVDEFAADGTEMNGGGLWTWDTSDRSEATVTAEIERLVAEADPDRERPEGMVPSSYFWIVDGDDFVGYLAVRHALTSFLLEVGGHIGYAVRPSRRGEGHAKRAFLQSLDVARELGLDRVLVTCDDDNPASAAVIEHGGGVLEDVRGGKRRYWVTLGT